MTEATPQIASSSESPSSGIKIATPDLIVQPQAVPIDALGQIYFENISGHEIINIARSELINGINVSYSLIGNLNQLKRNYNSLNIFSLPETIDKYFKNFAITLNTHVPEEGSGPGGKRAWLADQDYPFANSGDIIIDVVNMEQNEIVEVEVLNNGVLLSDTIYEGES